jgi:DNA recombination protein RmuC
MEIIVAIVGVLAGALLTGGVVWLVLRDRGERSSGADLADEAVRRMEAEQQASAEHRAEMQRLFIESQQRLAAEQARAVQDLAGKKSSIDETLEVMGRSMTDELGRVNELVRELERDREQKFGQLANAIQLSHEQLATLAETTQGLRQALSSTKARGQWGERMADDVLRLHGFVEGINYRKQHAIDAGIPDFTFMLPDGLSLYMDVKFPLDNYLKYLEADSEFEQHRARDDFLRDVRGHVKTLAARGYGDTTSESVDCVLLFIPNEALYSFIHEQDRTILDDALAKKLVFCSPLTLYAVLAVIRQAVDNFRVERTSHEILGRLATFAKQWGAFVDKMDKLDRSLGTARKDFDEIVGVRRKGVERELEKIEQLRRSPSLDAAPLGAVDRGASDHDDPGDPHLALEA